MNYAAHLQSKLTELRGFADEIEVLLELPDAERLRKAAALKQRLETITELPDSASLAEKNAESAP